MPEICNLRNWMYAEIVLQRFRAQSKIRPAIENVMLIHSLVQLQVFGNFIIFENAGGEKSLLGSK